MKQRIFLVALALCLCISSQSAAYASEADPSRQDEILAENPPEEPDAEDDEGSEPQAPPLLQEDGLPKETQDGSDTGDEEAAPLEASWLQENVLSEEDQGEPDAQQDSAVPAPAEAYASMTALKDQDMYAEGAVWTDDEPYSDEKGYYRWKGGPIDGKNIVATGCVAFAFSLSDAAFGSLPARSYAAGGFSFEDIKVGDILRVNNDAHTVIVLEVSNAGVIVAEGNISTGDNQGKVHWGRGISREEVMRDTSHYITRYPEGYIQPDDPGADESIAKGTLDGGLAWNLTKAGTLTISGQGAMPDFESTADQPWDGSKIRKVVIEDGVTNIGSCAFWGCQVISAEISSSVASIGNSAFRGTAILSVTIPSSVKTIGDSAFCECANLNGVTVCEGVETIGQNAFRACTNLASIALPASTGEVGDAAFFECTEMKNATFAPGSKKVRMGDDLFARCWNLMGVTLPSDIDRISKEMFLNCGMLAGVEIPQGAESIGESAFASCFGLAAVIIPDSVTVIERAAFANCSLKDIYFTGTEAQWNSISKIADTASAISEATVHYNYVPPVPDPGPGDSGDNDGSAGNKPGSGGNDNNGADNPGMDNPGGDHQGTASSGDTPGSDSGGKGYSGTKAATETWKPVTPDEKKRYACMGKEKIEYILPKDNAYRIAIENAMQGPMCFQSFEAVLGDYTIGRTYNIYPSSVSSYNMDKEIQFTIKIPSAIYEEGREYKMICVTEGGQPVVYNDSDRNPETITIKTNQFYAYALIYK